MNFSKLLCLVLVYSQQFGQVLLTAVQTSEDCPGDGTKTVTCKRKKGETVKLKIGRVVTTSVEWKKGTTPITADAEKYAFDTDNNKILTIMALKEGDEGEYTAGTTPEEKFQVQVVTVCAGDVSAQTTCKGKPGGELELESEGANGPYNWKKDNNPITAAAAKYSGLDAKAMTIKNLEDDDEGEYKGTATDQGIAVQVADCFGTGTAAGTLVVCNGKRGENLKLRISESVTGADSVTWEKVDGKLPNGHEKKGSKDEGLILKTLAAPDAGTYKAKYDSKTVSFAVSIPGIGTKTDRTTKSPTMGKGVIRGSGSGSGNTTDTVVVRTKPRDENGHGGGGSVLSYSPALLVTVTLVHLLLQLAA